jgi:hypothetical protein
MTPATQDFFARYRLLQRVADEDGVRTHNALEERTQRVVMVHVVDGKSDDVATLGAAIDRLPDAESARVLAVERIADGFAIVTEFLPGFTSLRAWLAARAMERSPDAPPDAPADGGAVKPKGEFTRLFGELRAPVSKPATPRRAPKPAVPPPSAEPGAPGEFTRLFGTPRKRRKSRE